MPNRRPRAGCLLAAIIVAALLLVWYTARFDEPWTAHGADFHLVLDDVRLPGALTLWQHRSDPQRLAVISTESGNPQPATVRLVDRRSGTQQRVSATFDELRRDYQPFEDAYADRAVEVRFRGINIPRPRPYLFGYPEPSGPGIALQPSLFGTLTVLDRATGRVLLTRTAINSGRVPSPFELARVPALGGGLALIDCVPGSRSDIWMFDRTQRTEKP